MSSKTLVSLATSALTLFGSAGCPRPYCVARGTRVRTPDGSAAIEDLKVGDSVVSVDPRTGEPTSARVIEIKATMRECVRLSTRAGELVCTSDHPIWSEEREEFVDAGNWALGYLSRLSRWKNDSLALTGVSNTSVFAGVNEVFDLVLDSAPHTFLANGFLVHNKSPACAEGYGPSCTCPGGTSSNEDCRGVCLCGLDAGADTGSCSPNLGAQCVCPDGVLSVYDCAGACECATTTDMSVDQGTPSDMADAAGDIGDVGSDTDVSTADADAETRDAMTDAGDTDQ